MSRPWLTAHLLVLCVLVLGAGASLLVFETVIFMQANGPSKMFNDATQTSRPRWQVAATMAMSALCVATAVCGFASICIKSPKLSTSFIGLVTVEFILRTLLCAITVYAVARLNKITANAVKIALLRYGSISDQTAIDFTAAVDSYSEKQFCCGWGIEEDGNSYLESEWYKLRFVNASASGTQSLPHSCCTSREAATIELCTVISSVRTARVEGKIYKNNCLDVFTSAMRKYLLNLIGAHILLLLIDAQFVYSSMKLVRHLTNDDDSDSGSLSPGTDAKGNAPTQAADDRDDSDNDDDDDDDNGKKNNGAK